MELPTIFFNHDAQAGGFYPLSHVGIDITGFGKNQNVLIEGIRGTGKTHVLRMIERYYFENYENFHVLPIFVSLAQISEHARKDPDEFRLHLYTHIVQRCLETIDTYQDDLQPDRNLLQKAFDSIKEMFGLSVEQDITNALSILKNTAVDLQTELQFDLTSKTFSSSTQDSNSTTSKVGGKIGVHIPQVVKGGIEATEKDHSSTTHTIEDRLMLMGSRLAHHNAVNFILEFLKQVQIMLNLDYSLILLDECSEASFAAQVEVFRLFKTIRGSNSRLPGKNTCAFFIGAVYPGGETYYPIREQDGFSFDPGHDCTMEFLQWDETDLVSYESFFRDMTLNRAREILAYKEDFTTLRDEIFENEETFLLAIYSAHGIPRRYWEIVKRGYDQSSKKILLGRVGIAIQEIVNDQILAHKSISEEDTNFVYHLVSVLSKKNIDIRRKNSASGKDLIPQNIYFSVNRRYKDILRRLIMQGAIHDKSRMRTISKPQRPQPIFAVDIAVVFTFRIIPPKRLVKVIKRDIPRCPTNDFDQSPEIWPREIKEIYEQGITVSLDDIAIDNDESIDTANSLVEGVDIDASTGESKPVNTQNNIMDGIVRSYQPNRYGLIEVFDGGPFAYFSSEQVNIDYRDSLQPEDRVQFNLIATAKGRQATNITVPELTVSVHQDQLQGLSNYVINVVRSSETPILLGNLASQMRNYFGDNIINTQWYGYGRFKNLLQHLDLDNLEVSPWVPGYIYDPSCHSNPLESGEHPVEHFLDIATLSEVIKSIIEENADDSGWINQGTVFAKIRSRDPEFDPRNFGFKKFGQLIISTEICMVEKRINSKRIRHLY